MTNDKLARDTERTITEIEQRRKDMDLHRNHLSEAAGYSSGAWGNAVLGEFASGELKSDVWEVLDYVEEHDYYPEPGELND